jgi:hypothetical protein
LPAVALLGWDLYLLEPVRPPPLAPCLPSKPKDPEIGEPLLQLVKEALERPGLPAGREPVSDSAVESPAGSHKRAVRLAAIISPRLAVAGA